MEYLLFSDAKLLEECSKDNLTAFNTLFDRYFGKLYRYALSYVKDECFAEEEIMDLMMWIWEKRHTLDIKGDFKPYIFRAAKNATIKAIRKKAIATSPVEVIENNLSFTAKPADHGLLFDELELIYQRQLNLLSPQRKTVFSMSREQDLSHAEIAGNLNISVHTVKNHIKFSLNHFRKNIYQYTDTAVAVIFGLILFWY
jgi:RNA polymerase sigma-70 factor (family 1)